MKKITFLTAILLASISFAQVPNYVPTNGLVGWWPFNGNANDESGNGNNGTVYGATLTTDRFGNVNSSYNFSNNLITIPYNTQLGFNPNGSFSIGIWAQRDGSQNVMHLIGKRSLSNPYFNWQIAYGNNYVTFQSGTGPGSTIGVVSNSIFPDQSWTYFTGVYNNSEWKFYVNGVLNNTSIGIATSDDLSDLTIGNSGGFEPFFGKLDDIGIWNRALSACEIQDLYNAQLNSSSGISAGVDLSICEGSDITLSGSGGSNYQWNNGVTNGSPFTPASTQDYIVIAEDGNGCLGSDTVNVEVLLNTASSQIQTALNNYTWPVNGQTYNQSGTYTDTLVNAAGCDSIVTLNLTLSYTGIEDLNLSNLVVSPNPTDGDFTITGKEQFGKITSIEIKDINGKVVNVLDPKATNYSLSALKQGVYFLVINSDKKQEVRKIVKE